MSLLCGPAYDQSRQRSMLPSVDRSFAGLVMACSSEDRRDGPSTEPFHPGKAICNTEAKVERQKGLVCWLRRETCSNTINCGPLVAGLPWRRALRLGASNMQWTS